MATVRSQATSTLALATYLAIGLQVLDLVTFPLALEAYGMLGESNTIMQRAYEAAGMLGIILFKLILILYLLVALRYLPNFKYLAIAIVAGIGLLGAATNILVYQVYG